jgi:hypothetical protein
MLLEVKQTVVLAVVVLVDKLAAEVVVQMVLEWE